MVVEERFLHAEEVVGAGVPVERVGVEEALLLRPGVVVVEGQGQPASMSGGRNAVSPLISEALAMTVWLPKNCSVSPNTSLLPGGADLDADRHRRRARLEHRVGDGARG